jgi:hypothetical protein
MPRRPNDLLAERVLLPFSSAALTADATTKLWTIPAGRSARVASVWMNPAAALAVDDTNYAIYKITDGTNIAASWSTKTTGGNGALVQDTPILMVLASDANVVLAGGEVVSLFIDEFSTVVSIPAVTGIIELLLL